MMHVGSVSLLLLCAIVVFGADSRIALLEVIGKNKMQFEVLDQGNALKCEAASALRGGIAATFKADNQWRTGRIVINPDGKNQIQIRLCGPNIRSRYNGEPEPHYIEYSTLKINGKVVINIPEESKDESCIVWYGGSKIYHHDAFDDESLNIEVKYRIPNNLPSNGIEPVSFLEFYMEPGKDSSVTFKINLPDSPQEINYFLSDYDGHNRREGKLIRENDRYKGIFNLKPGYYELDIPLFKRKFGLMAIPAFKGKTDEFWALQTDCAGASEHDMRQTVLLMKRSGINTMREWHGWAYEEPSKGSWRPAKDKLYPFAAEHDLKVLFYFDHPPKWTTEGASGENCGYHRFPRHLLELENLVKRTILTRGYAANYIQIDNEPDLAHTPPDSFMALLKTYSWLLANNNSPMKIVGPAFSTGALDGNLIENYIESGFLDSIDIFAFHIYEPPTKMIEYINYYRNILSTRQKTAMPLWITECGKAWPRKREGATEDALRPLPADDRESACFTIMNAVMAKSGGVTKYAPFRFPRKPEGNGNFGMSDPSRTPLRSMGGYLFATLLLSNKKYVGDFVKKFNNVQLSPVFSDGQENIIVLYTGRTGVHKLQLGDIRAKTIYGIDGRLLKSDSNNDLEISDGMVYLVMDSDSLNPLINTATSTMELLKKSYDYQPHKKKNYPVIYQFAHWDFPDKDNTVYFGDIQKLKMNVYNLSGKTEKTSPELVLPVGGRIIDSNGLPKNSILEPHSVREVIWHIDLSECKEMRRNIVIRDLENPDFPVLLTFCDYSTLPSKSLKLNNFKRWNANSAGQMEITWDTSENAIKFHTDFKPGSETWIYPEYILQLPQENLARVVQLSFEIKVRGENHDNLGSPMTHTTYTLGNVYQKIKFSKPTEVWSEKKLIFPSNIKMSEVKKLRIGLCAPVDVESFDYWLRNIKLHYLPEGDSK